jgi:chromosomal replication initiation ATPase DnaA
MMNEITRQCLLLSNGEKVRLISDLKASMAEDVEDDGSRFSLIFKAATDVVGKGILTNLRLRELVVGRMLIIYQMRIEGYSLQTIGRHLIRNHCSVLHLQKKMEDVIKYPHLFPLEIKMWNEFNDKLKEYEYEMRSQRGQDNP